MTDKAPHSLRFDFNEAVNETLRDFPALGDKVVFVDVLDDNKKYGTPSAIKESAMRHPARRMAENLQIVHAQQASLSFNKNTYGIGAVLFHSGNHHQIFSKDDRNVSSFASFDHELGHLLTREGFNFNPQHPQGEASADAYAALRHLQRFGTDGKTLEHASFKRALHFIMTGDIFYLTSPVIDAINNDKKSIDFSGLTPLETVKKAEEYAANRSFKEPELSQLLAIFAPVRQSFLLHEEGSTAPLRNLADTILGTHSNAQAFHLGKKVLTRLMDDGILTNPEWKEIREKLGKRMDGIKPSPPSLQP